MKTVIFYSSTYNGNTLKIAESIAATLSADLIAIETKISDFDLSQYDLIGIGSAIHFGQHAIRLQRFVSALPLQGKNIFIFSTRCRPFLGNYHRTLKNIIKQKKANLVDEFSCVGFDRTGPWVLINGYNKNRPNTNDLFKARLFAEKLQCKLHPLSSVITSSTATESKQGIVLFQKEQNKIANNKVVFLNISSCIQCSKCINVCPMNVFQKKDAILPVHGENCIQCQLCAKTAPQILYISKNHLQTDCVSPYEKYSVLDYRIAISLKNKKIDTLISILKKLPLTFYQADDGICRHSHRLL